MNTMPTQAAVAPTGSYAGARCQSWSQSKHCQQNCKAKSLHFQRLRAGRQGGHRRSCANVARAAA
jgi:hypothetical protein